MRHAYRSILRRGLGLLLAQRVSKLNALLDELLAEPDPYAGTAAR